MYYCHLHCLVGAVVWSPIICIRRNYIFACLVGSLSYVLYCYLNDGQLTMAIEEHFLFVLALFTNSAFIYGHFVLTNFGVIIKQNVATQPLALYE